MPKLFDTKSLQHPKKGFTLIELLISITIISILIGIGTFSWMSGQVKSRDSRRKSDLKLIQQSLDSYFLANGEYPPKSQAGVLCGQLYSMTGANGVATLLVPAFIPKLPQDPTFPGTASDYFYKREGPTTYKLYATLENANDQDYVASYAGSDGSGCGALTNVYHYRAVSP